MFACRLDMHQQMQPVHRHCLNMWMRRLTTPGAGRQDYFLALSLARHPGGGAPVRQYELVRVENMRAVGAVRLRKLPAMECWLVPCYCCPIHQQLACEQRWLARRTVAHCYARGYVWHLVAVAGATASSHRKPCRRGWHPIPAVAAAGQASLHFTGFGGDGRTPTAGEPHAQPTGSVR